MPEKVYLLTYGELADKVTVGVFASIAAAERKILADVLSTDSRKVVPPYIEEWEVRG